MDWSKVRDGQEERKEERRAKARAMLTGTDWYIIRSIDPSAEEHEIPVDVILRRRAARKTLKEDGDG